VRYISYLDPLTYGVDGLRSVLIGVSSFSVAFNSIILTGCALVMVLLGAYFFEKSESV
jgi:ABC-2 type transport system permease protein